jgi:CHAT domain-containing protein/tetratricopeptide (TPR) repeat protein
MKWKLYHLLLASVLSFGGQVVQPLRDFDFVAAQTAPPPSPTQSKIQQGLELVIQGRKAQDRQEWNAAVEKFQQALAIFQQEGDRRFAALTQNLLGQVYESQRLFSESLTFYQQAREGIRGLGDQQNEALINSSVARVLVSLEQPQSAEPYYVQALNSYAALGDRDGQARTYSNWGMSYVNAGNAEKGIGLLIKAAELTPDNYITLNNLGFAHRRLGQYDKAVQFYERALRLARSQKDDSIAGSILNNLAGIYRSQGNFSKALEFYQLSLQTLRSLGDQRRVALTENNLGDIYNAIGQYAAALAFYERALQVIQNLGDRRMESVILSNIAIVHDNRGAYSQALALFERALAIQRSLSDLRAEGITLSNIGAVYDKQKQNREALEAYGKALEIMRQVGDRSGEATVLSNIGLVFSRQAMYDDAQNAYHQALAIYRALGERPGESITLNNLGLLFKEKQETELAIIFYKQAVNITESLRRDLRSFTQADRQAYAGKVADTYRNLANLLLQQDRVLEAQQVLDLLKVQELQDYLKDVRGNEQTARGLDLLPSEQRIITDYNTIQNRAVQAERELTDLLRLPQPTPAQIERMLTLREVQRLARQQIREFFSSPAIAAILRQSGANATRADNLSQFRTLQARLQQMQSRTAIFYPLILSDRLELVLVLPQGQPIRRVVHISSADLNRAVIAMRSDVRDPSSLDILSSSKKLYDILIAPLAQELSANQIQTIIYAPDSALRYIPLSALHDGKQWLVQKYSINHVTAASLTNLAAQKRLRNPRVLAGAFAAGEYSFRIGDRQFTFAGLPFAGKEVSLLADKIPNTTKLLNREFSAANTISQLNRFNIVHLATHASFVVGQPEDSFVMFGDGSRSSLRDVSTWILKDVDLVVLSACETGIGGKLGTGEEIMGFGYQMQYAGAKAAIASLWQVSDGGTQSLMTAFYSALKDGKFSKAEALAEAQKAMIGSKSQSLNLSHPYYWSAFILIGNGL